MAVQAAARYCPAPHEEVHGEQMTSLSGVAGVETNEVCGHVLMTLQTESSEPEQPPLRKVVVLHAVHTEHTRLAVGEQDTLSKSPGPHEEVEQGRHEGVGELGEA